MSFERLVNEAAGTKLILSAGDVDVRFLFTWEGMQSGGKASAMSDYSRR